MDFYYQNIDQVLLKAYQETTYRVDFFDLKLHIDQDNTRLQQLLCQQNWQNWAFLTASNPRSEVLSFAKNKSRNQDLQHQLQALALVTYAGVGIGTDPNWIPEHSFFIPNITQEVAHILAQKHQQNAYVWGNQKQAPTLVWCI